MPLFACGGCVIDLFVTQEELIDKFTGPDQQLWLWACNTWGALGNNNTITRYSSPVQTVSSGTDWKCVVAGGVAWDGTNGEQNTTAAIKKDGTLWLWGAGDNGVHGNNSTLDRSSPVQTVSGGTNWKEICISSDSNAVGIKTDGTLWVWGRNQNGQLGIQNNICMSSPVQTVSGGTNWKQATTGLGNTGAVKTDGTLWLWGYNGYGQLGFNTGGPGTGIGSPRQTAIGGTDWKSITMNGISSVAIKTDGTLWTWGCNTYGNLGHNDIIRRSTPTQMASNGTMWNSIATGRYHATGIKTDGTLWSWGRGSYGVHGNNLILNRSSPVQTVSGGTNWRCISAGDFNSMGIKTDGTLWAWGYGRGGDLGNNIGVDRSSPVQTISGGTNWKTVSTGRVHSGAICIKEF